MDFILPKLKIERLTCGYTNDAVLQDLSFEVQGGECVFITGRNGVGKSTLLRALLGYLPTDGLITLNSQSVTGEPEQRIRNYGFAYLPQRRKIFETLSVRDNIHNAGRFLNTQSTAILADWLNGNEKKNELIDAGYPLSVIGELLRNARPLLPAYGDSLSGGEKTLVGLLCAVLLSRTILLIDEPSAGLNFANRDLVARLFAAITQNKRGLLVVEQDERLVKLASTRQFRLEDVGQSAKQLNYFCIDDITTDDQ